MESLKKSLQKTLIVALLLLTPRIVVEANVVNASTLPGLTERATNGLNSRYLSSSAQATASLAAANVVAASNGPQPSASQQQQQQTAAATPLTSQSQQSGNSQTSTQNSQQNSNQQEANRNYILHQQQLHQQQLVANGNQQQQQQQQVQQQQAQQQLASPVQLNQQQAPQQYNNVQSGLGSQTTPVMSTTFTFNPLLNQFVPSDLTAGLLPAQVQPSYNQFNPNQQQQQQNLFPVGANPYGGSSTSSQFSSPSRFQTVNGYQQLLGFGAQQSQFPNNLNLNQIIQQQRLLNRRNGYQANSAYQTNRFPSNNYQQSSFDGDEASYFNQPQGGQLNDFTNPDSTYGNLPGNSYLVSSNNNHHQQHPYNDNSLSPSSVSNSLIIPTQTTSFNTAFTGAPNSAESGKNDQCIAADNRHGTCYSASECIRRNGTPMGKCNGNSASSFVGELSGTSYVCCLFDVTCGSFAAERFVYFRNPNYPNTYDQSRMCRTRIGKLDKSICQYRLDLIRFDVAKPINGNCSSDMFVVSGQNENYVIPKICGLNDGQHYYVGVDESGIITLHMMMMGFYRRNFEILVTQIPCRSDFAAPAHCLQYYMGTHGTIKSFNYDDELLHGGNQLIGNQVSAASSVNYDLLPQAANDLVSAPMAPYNIQFAGTNSAPLQQRQMFHNQYQQQRQFGQQVNYADQFGGYPNDLDYTMCIRKESGFCSITYQLSRSDQGPQPFAVGHSSMLMGSNSSGQDQQSWHQVSTECRDDYLLIGGVRLCSGNSNSPFTASGFDPAIQFSQNGSILGSSGISGVAAQQQQQQQQQLQNQYNLLMQQLARLQQQQFVNGSLPNVNQANNNLLVGQQQQQQQQQQGSSNNNNLEQQQAAIIQQTMLIQQQMNLLASQQQNNRYQQQFDNINGQQHSTDLQNSIITDTTSGPFLLRFVSNLARNARGFHIDYRQNPCK